MNRVHVYFRLEPDEDGYPPVTEEVDAEIVDQHSCRVVGVPVFAYGVAPDDVVSTGVGQDGKLWTTGILKHGLQWVFRVIPSDKSQREFPKLTQLARSFENWGCRAQPSSFGLLAVAVPPHVEAKTIVSFLEAGEKRGEWYFDLGVDPFSTP